MLGNGCAINVIGVCTDLGLYGFNVSREGLVIFVGSQTSLSADQSILTGTGWLSVFCLALRWYRTAIRVGLDFLCFHGNAARQVAQSSFLAESGHAAHSFRDRYGEGEQNENEAHRLHLI